MSLNDNPRALEKKKNTNKQLNSEAVEILGEDLVEILRFANPPVPEREIPESVEKNIMDSYRKAYRYKIRWRKVKINIRDFISFLSSNARTNAVVLASVVMVFIIIAAVYYQYQSNHIKPDLTSNKQPPVIKINPSPTPTPEVTPIATPNIAENNKQDNDNKLNTNIRNKDNRQAVITKNQQKINKGNNQVKQDKSIPQNNTIKNTYNNEPEQIAMLERERGQNATLATIKNIYISDLIDTDLRNALIELLQTNGFKVIKNLANEPFEASLEYSFSEKNVIALSVKNRQVWKKSLDSSSPKQEAQAIVTSLLEAIEQAKKYLKNSKL